MPPHAFGSAKTDFFPFMPPLPSPLHGIVEALFARGSSEKAGFSVDEDFA